MALVGTKARIVERILCGEQRFLGEPSRAPPWDFRSLVVEPTILRRLLDYERSQAKARASTKTDNWLRRRDVVADFLCLEICLKSRILKYSVERVGKGSDAIGRSVRCLQGRC